MRIELDYLELQNFKGIDSFRLNLGGQPANVMGKNGTGKTTLADAFYWLITDTNADNNGNFNPLSDKSRNDINDKMPAIVEAGMFIGSKSYKLKKVFCKKFIQKKGGVDYTFTGHTTEYFIDDVPLKKSEYMEKLNGFFNLEVFRTLSDVKYFCAVASADYRRKILLQLAGETDDDKIFEENLELAPVKELIQEKSVEECKRLFNSKKLNSEKEMKEIPIRIDTILQTLSDTGEYSIEAIDKLIEQTKKRLKLKRAAAAPDVAAIEHERKLAERRHSINRIEHEIERHDMTIASDSQRLIYTQKAIERLDTKIQKNIEERQALKKELDQAHGETLDTDANRCKLCGQLLPGEKLVEMIEAFKRNKNQCVGKINKRGKDLFNTFNQLTAEKAKKETEKKELKALMKEVAGKIELLKERLSKESSMDPNNGDFCDSGDDAEIIAVESDLARLEKRRYAIELSEKNRAILDHLKRRQKEVAGEYEKAVKTLYLLDEYRQHKYRMIEESVNRHFKMTRWSLFETRINQTVHSICEATCNDIAFKSDLNTGAKINVGLDCINVLSKYFNLRVPVFVDNAESVTEFIPTDSQIIKLTAVKRLKNLKVQINGE
jgi:hypothetical protein